MSRHDLSGDRSKLDLDTLFRELDQVPSDLHQVGAISPRILREIAKIIGGRRMRATVETGAGMSTLFLSHLSDNHTAFALDKGNSLGSVRDHPLLRREAVRFVEGPSQETLPAHRFGEPIDFALLDGPHAYPFPELEYYYLYPHLSEGALLVIDDLEIPTVGRLFEILSLDAMFKSITVIAERTGVLERTSAPVLDPLADGWWLQGFNMTPRVAYRKRRFQLQRRWRQLLSFLANR